jgi:hypothetical protein
MQNKPSLPDAIFGRIAQATVQPWSRRTFISRLAGAAIFFISAAKYTHAQEGGCTPASCVGCCGPLAYGTCPWVEGCCAYSYRGTINYFLDNPLTQQCCGNSGPIGLGTETNPLQCCEYSCSSYTPPGGSPEWDCATSAGYYPSTQGCCNDGVYNLCTQGCCDGLVTYNLSTTCCCGGGDGTTIACVPDSTLVPPPGC